MEKGANPFLKIDNGHEVASEAGKEHLTEIVTNADSQVYAFNGDISPTTVSALFARLSRSPLPIKETYLKEFTGNAGKDEELLRRVVTMFGDDSVQQLAGIQMVIEDASNLATKKIEWGRLAAYLEQSTRYIFYDQKDENGKYKYFTPENLTGDVAESYETSMDKIFDTYSSVVHEMVDYFAAKSSVPEEERDGAWRAAIRAQACDVARPILPVATKSTVGVYASAQALDNMIMRFRASENAEERNLGVQLLTEARKVMPSFFERTDKPERGAGTSAYMSAAATSMRALAKRHLGKEHEGALIKDIEIDNRPVLLSSHIPGDEMEILPSLLFDVSDLPEAEIKRQLDTLNKEERQEIFDAYFGERLNRRHRPGRALENINYGYEIVCDYGIFRDLQRHRMVNDLRWQKLSPNLGYEIPEAITAAGLQDKFTSAFDESKKMYDTLMAAGLDDEAQYATLFGHNMRWHFSMNAREAFHLLELRTSPQGHPGYRKLCKQMFDEIEKVHPRLAGHMKFINKGEDPELTRLAAERATQLKLQQLDKVKNGGIDV